MFNKQIFKYIPDKTTGKFVYRKYRRDIYNDYLTKRDIEISLSGFLRAICITTECCHDQWNIHKKFIYFYNKNSSGKLIPTLSDKLCKKIMKSINKDYMELIENCIYDYHILLDENDEMIPLKHYPLIFFAGVYFEIFDMVFLSEDLTKKEWEEIGKMCSGNNVIVELKDKIKLVKLRAKTKGKVNNGEIITETFPKTKRGIIELIISATSSTVNNITDEQIEKLWKILKITDCRK